MRKMAHGHLDLLFDVGQEGPLVVDFEGENAMLIGKFERGGEGCGVGIRGNRNEREAMEWGEHGKFDLNRIWG